MKCDELKVIDFDKMADVRSLSGLFYRKYEVDEAIAELKVRNVMFHDEAKYYKFENESLKAKLESLQASAYADSVDAGMRERRLRRALWLARAERAKEMCRRLLIQGFDPKWEKVERKCLKKAEAYK